MISDSHKIPFQGQSMNPLLADVEFVLVDFSNKKKPSIGEIVLYRDQNKEWVCHRLIDETETHFWLKGDANTTADVVLKGIEYGVVRGAIRGNQTYKVASKFVTPLICILQRRQVTSHHFFFKKIYRSLLKVFLYLDAI